MSEDILVLNQSYLPLGRISKEKGLCLVYLQKALVVKSSGKKIRSVNQEFDIPEIIVLPNVSYVRRNFSHPSRKNVFKRDNYTCVYCRETSKQQLTLDHVIPRVRFNKIAKEKNLDYKVSSWQNLVCACKQCNSWKDDRLLEEIGITIKRPAEPFFDLDLCWNTLFDAAKA